MPDASIKGRVRRPRKNAIMFVLSLALGAIGVFYSKHYIEAQIAHYRGQLDRTEPMVKVVVPNRPLRSGEIVTAASLSMRDIPARYADSNSVGESDFEIALGQRVDFDVDQGRPLLWAHLAGGLSPTFSGKVPEGLRAMTVRVDEVNSISGFLQPRDRVDLLLSHGSGTEQEIVPLIERLDVIATGVQTVVDKAGGARRSFSTITVQVSPEEAQRITLAQQVGKLTATLRNPDDETPLDGEPMTVARLLGLAEKPVPIVRAAVAKPRPAPRPAAPAPAGIEYIIGGTR